MKLSVSAGGFRVCVRMTLQDLTVQTVLLHVNVWDNATRNHNVTKTELPSQRSWAKPTGMALFGNVNMYIRNFHSISEVLFCHI